MHVIAKPALVAFWTDHPDAEGPLAAWHRLMEASTFADFNELRDTFASADYVAPFTVFNIGGNKYRLIAVIHYNRGKVYIRHVLTHRDYDKEKWKAS
jgi:mRNA interferase HigB